MHSAALAMLLLATGACVLADPPPAKTDACEQAIRAYRDDPGAPALERRLRDACFTGPARAPTAQPPISVGTDIPAPVVPQVAPVAPAISTPSAPSVLTQCDAGGCWDAQGLRYSGTGVILQGPDGAPCTRIGDRIECRPAP